MTYQGGRTPAAGRHAEIRVRYDPATGRLVYLMKPADRGFWEGHWARTAPSDSELLRILRNARSLMVARLTAEFAGPEDGPVLEGGCGLCTNVAALVRKGYRCVGLDSAADTVGRVKRLRPDLDVLAGDVRRLPFAGGSFAAYWSLGVMEHFAEGYMPVIEEARRVLKPGGILFASFPWMNPLRRRKAREGAYPEWDGSLDGFYQYAFPADAVAADMEEAGFSQIRRVPYGGVKGVKDDGGAAGSILRPLAAGPARNPAIKAAVHLLDLMLSGFGGHMMLLVLKKR